MSDVETLEVRVAGLYLPGRFPFANSASAVLVGGPLPDLCDDRRGGL